jgi:hypothetical protein
MTVGELRKKLEGVNENTTVLLEHPPGKTLQIEAAELRTDVPVGRWAKGRSFFVLVAEPESKGTIRPSDGES